MLPEYNEQYFDDQALQCNHCRWQGKGIDAVVIDLFGVTSKKEVHCPNCDETIGILKKEDNAPGETANDLSFQLG